jgi:hypothetical protein
VLKTRVASVMVAAAVLAIALGLVLAGAASAQDLSAGLSEAESRAEVAAVEVEELEGDAIPAEAKFEASSKRATPAEAAAKAAKQRVARIEDAQRSRRFAAIAEISRIESANHDAAEKHDDKVRSGLGFGLAALIMAGIALAWGWFRASAVIDGLTRMTLGRAIGLCVGGGLLAVIVGAAMGNVHGLVGGLGIALLGLGFMLPIALLLARHSIEVQHGRSKPVLRRERLPRWVAQSVCGVMGVLCLIGVGAALFAGEAESKPVSSQLRLRASEQAPGEPALAGAEQQAAGLDKRAASLLAVTHSDRLELRAIKRQLGRAESRLTSANSEAHNFTRRLVALSAREEREAAAEEREFAILTEEEPAAEECDPNYSGCLDPNASDYDCEGGSGNGPDYTGEVQVLGVDHYGLDADGDGVGCEAE